MKNSLLILFLFLSIKQVQAQNTINITGEIKNTNPEEIIYIILDGSLIPLKIMQDGNFVINGDIQQIPSFFYFAKVSNRGKIEAQTSRIWFEKEQIKIMVDWSNKTFRNENATSFQSISEKIEVLNVNKNFDFVLKNSNEIPSLYFIDFQKEKISIANLEKYYKSLNEDNKKTIYANRIINYLSAKKRKDLKKGGIFENFKLPNKSGNYIDVVNDKNKIKVIALLSSGCSYSIASIHFLKNLSASNNDKIEIVSIWDDQSKNTWLYSHQDKKDKITWKNLWDEYGFAKTYLNRKMWPTFYVINENGELSQILEGYDKKTVKSLTRLVE